MKLFKKFCYYVFVYLMVELAIFTAKLLIRFVKGIVLVFKLFKAVKKYNDMEETKRKVVVTIEKNGKIEYV